MYFDTNLVGTLGDTRWVEPRARGVDRWSHPDDTAAARQILLVRALHAPSETVRKAFFGS